MDIKYDHLTAQTILSAKWQQEKTYSPANNPGKLYSIDTPPPTVSGSLHIGHIFSYTQTDIVARYKRMSGYSVFYPFGFDDNGLPTERYVEKKQNVRPHEIGRSAFIQLCLEQTKEAEHEFKKLWQTIGLSVDWDYWYSTISPIARRLSQLSFIKLYKDGFIYRKDEPAIYCTTCRTTVAQAELDDLEVPSFFCDIIFKDQDGNDLIISTTRPELLYSTSALVYHPEDSRYQHLRNKKAIVPIYNTVIPIYADELVDPQKGSGLVMVSTFGDQTDIQWYKKHKLPLRLSIGLDGKWIPQTGILAGLKVHEARAKITDELTKQGRLLHKKPITHAVKVHERCKKEVEYIVLTQWFVSILKHKETFLAFADTISWHPQFMKSRYANWVENIKWDWCISRQRFYGIPFPVWYCRTCHEIIVAHENDLPIDPQEISYPGSVCPSCKGNDIVPDTDVMDTWNTSSITPYICFNLFSSQKDPFTKNRSFIPMAMRPQAHDIIRTWAFYTIVKTWMHNKSIPWRDIVISGHVLSDAKEKISKSKDNNPLAPENLLKQYPADAIRYWTASGSLGHDINFSETQLKNGQRLSTKLWNAFRFAEPHITHMSLTKKPKDFGIVNEWVLDKISQIFNKYQTHFAHHEFGLALTDLEAFFWSDFCDNYLELIKNQLFNPDQYAPDHVYATKWTLYYVGLRILQLYAPYLPYITETIYQQLYAQTLTIASLHQTKFAAIQQTHTYKDARITMTLINDIVSAVRKAKTSKQLSLNTPLTQLTIASAKSMQRKLEKHEQLLKGVTRATTITYTIAEQHESTVSGHESDWQATVFVEPTSMERT